MINVKVTGTGLVAKVIGRDIPNRIVASQRESMAWAVADLRAKLTTDANKSRNSGTFVGSITTRIEGTPSGERYLGYVGPTAPYGQWVEFGRGPGRMPPIDDIATWAAEKLGDESLAFVVARSIAAKGTLLGKRTGHTRGWAHAREVKRKRRRTIVTRFRRGIKRAVRLGRS